MQLCKSLRQSRADPSSCLLKGHQALKTTNHSCSAETPLGNCGFVWQRKGHISNVPLHFIIQAKGCSFKPVKRKNSYGSIIYFFLFSSMSEDLEILQESCLPSTALGRADAAELQEWIFHNFLHSVFLQVSKKRSTS